MVSRIAIATHADGAPMALVSDLSNHTKALRENPSASLLLGEPGDRGDPRRDSDLSGQCYVTDNAQGDADVDGGPTRLTSPTLDASALPDPDDVRVSYHRWFTSESGTPDSLLVEVSNDDGQNWTTLETALDGPVWQRVTLPIGVPLPHDQIAGTVEEQDALLLFGFDRDKAHRRARDSFADCFRIDGVRLATFDIGLHVHRRHQPDFMAEPLKLPRPVVARSASFHADQTGL